eukprot:8455509-Pyramimonas_sp.AAC.1
MSSNNSLTSATRVSSEGSTGSGVHACVRPARSATRVSGFRASRSSSTGMQYGSSSSTTCG